MRRMIFKGLDKPVGHKIHEGSIIVNVASDHFGLEYSQVSLWMGGEHSS